MKRHQIRILTFVILIIAIIVAIFSSNKTTLASNYPHNLGEGYYLYNGEVPHFFTHQIINNPQKAFNSKLSHHFDKDCITHTELKNFLEQMYKNNYCLVDIYDVVKIEDGKAKFKDLFVPLNKKPFLLSFDDMSYDNIGMGLSDKIILDDNGNFASLTSSNENKIEYDKEFVCIIEDFIKNHPDFSCRNARAIICPTGYDGILGYRINKSGWNRKKDLEEIKPLIKKLKSLNYHFACHTYNHIEVAYQSDSVLFDDLKKYQDEIISVIGETPIFCFPCGSAVTKGSKLKILNKFGYKIFFCVGDAVTQEKNDSIFMKREVLNGISIRNYQKEYSPFFENSLIYDHENRKIKFPYKLKNNFLCQKTQKNG